MTYKVSTRETRKVWWSHDDLIPSDEQEIREATSEEAFLMEMIESLDEQNALQSWIGDQIVNRLQKILGNTPKPASSLTTQGTSL